MRASRAAGASALARAADCCARLQTLLMVACLAVMVVLLFGNVALRYLFNSGINVSDELSRLAFVWMIFLGSVLALREHQHIGVTMLVERFGPAARRVTHVLCQLLTLWVLWLMAEGSWTQTLIGLDTRLPVTGLPLAVFNAAALYAAAAMGLLTLVDLVRVLAGGPCRPNPAPRIRWTDPPHTARTRKMILTVFLIVLLGLIALGMPIAFALLLSAITMMFQLDFFDTQILSQNMLSGANSFTLMAVPLFMLAGELMNAGGISRRIVNLASMFVGHIQGGLGYVAIFASVLLAALSGSAVADAAALGSLLIPMLREKATTPARLPA